MDAKEFERILTKTKNTSIAKRVARGNSFFHTQNADVYLTNYGLERYIVIDGKIYFNYKFEDKVEEVNNELRNSLQQTIFKMS